MDRNIKIGIVLFSNLRYSPYLRFYTDILSRIDCCEYKIVYFNRYKELDELNDESYIPINWLGKNGNASSKFVKLINFIRFKNKAIKILKKEKFDFLIVLPTIPSILLSDYLCKNYNGRYITDVRDFTYENLKWFYNKEKKVFNYAAQCVISSPGFKQFLPERKYLISHNISIKSDKVFSLNINRKPPIIISYIGSIGYVSQCKKMIDLVAKDSRFCFRFYGNDVTGEITRYVQNLHNERISIIGAFTPSEKPYIYEASDIVFNCYGNDSMLVKSAISNKYYDGAIYRRPLLVSPNTIMQEVSGTFAYPLDLNNADNLDGLFNWYENLDEEEYETFAQNVINSSLTENENTKNLILQSIKGVLNLDKKESDI